MNIQQQLQNNSNSLKVTPVSLIKLNNNNNYTKMSAFYTKLLHATAPLVAKS
jgi:hypothetical protein